MALYPQDEDRRPGGAADSGAPGDAALPPPRAEQAAAAGAFHRPNVEPIDYAASEILDLPTWAQAHATAAPPGAWATAARALWPWGLNGVAETLEVVGLALLMFLLVRSGTGNFIVDGRSMFPAFNDGEMLIVNKLAYRTFDVSWLPFTDEEAWSPLGPGDPQTGDVVVFRFRNDPGRDFIKRVIATSGQTVVVRDGTLLVDGRPFEEPYLSEPPFYNFGPEVVGPGEVFVLGDNRNNSYDSHQWGMLDAEFVIGRAELRYWPLSDFGRIGAEEPVPLESGVVGAGVSPSP